MLIYDIVFSFIATNFMKILKKLFGKDPEAYKKQLDPEAEAIKDLVHKAVSRQVAREMAENERRFQKASRAIKEEQQAKEEQTVAREEPEPMKEEPKEEVVSSDKTLKDIFLQQSKEETNQ